MNISRNGLQALFVAETQNTAFPTDGSSPVPLSVLPTGTGTSAAIECGDRPAYRFIFGGTDAANETINYRVITWKLGNGVYLPRVVATGVATLGAMPMTVSGLDSTATLIADTITETLGTGGVMVRSPANNTCADITVWPGGDQYVTVESDRGTAATASCYFEPLDEAAAASIMNNIETNLGNVGILNTSETEINPATLASVAGDVDAGAIGTAAVGATTTVVLAAAAGRRNVIITNLSTSVVYLAFGTAAVSTHGVPLAAAVGAGDVGGSYEVAGALAALAINGISDGADKDVAYQTGSAS